MAQLQDSIEDIIREHLGDKPFSANLIPHCVREAFHAQWGILLDDAFIQAYRHGIVVTCLDGITRRFYPRFFTYSADYKEKFVFFIFLFFGALNAG